MYNGQLLTQAQCIQVQEIPLAYPPQRTNDMELTTQQNKVLEQIKAFLNSDASVFILRGYAGTGKTTMVKVIADYIVKSR